jgi:3-oxoacyl-[acyl-carrier protein] reductase
MSTFEGRVALVTGGSRGIGKAVAVRLAALSAEVVIAARGLEAAEQTAEKIREDGGRAKAVALDIANADSVDETCKALLDCYGKIPLLVNNAGVTRDNLLLRMKPAEWDEVIETNLSGIYRMCRALLPSMIRSRYGRIVNITSVVGHVGNPGQANYCASKAGIEGYTRSLARELASRNVTANCVAPGFIDTDMTKDLGDKARESLLAQVPLKRLGTPDDVAGAALFLLGNDADYITGTTLHVNGGMYM